MCPKALPDRPTATTGASRRDDDIPGHALAARQERSREWMPMRSAGYTMAQVWATFSWPHRLVLRATGKPVKLIKILEIFHK
jgi:hypothetical protein